MLLQKSNEDWDKSRNELQLVYRNAKIQSEMTVVAVHSRLVQFEGKSHILQVLSNSVTCMRAEKRLFLDIKCLHVLLNNPQVPEKRQTIKVTPTSIRVVLLKLVQKETMSEVIEALRFVKVSRFKKLLWIFLDKKDRIIYYNFSSSYLFFPKMDCLESVKAAKQRLGCGFQTPRFSSISTLDN